MTKQEAYERIRAHFDADPRYGYRPETAERDSTCLYLTDDGAKCAVGCLIPDGSPMQEAQGGVWTLTRDYTAEFNAVFGTTFEVGNVEWGQDEFVSFLSEVQSRHDTCAMRNDPMPAFLSELDRVAEYHGLQVVSD